MGEHSVIGPRVKGNGESSYGGFFSDLDDPCERALLSTAVEDWKVFTTTLDAWVNNHPRGVMRPTLVEALTAR
jgi:hypothetical protein